METRKKHSDSSTSPVHLTLCYLRQNKTKDFPSTVSLPGLSPILQSAWFYFNRVTLDGSPLSLLAKTGGGRAPVLQPQPAAVHSAEQHRAAGEAPQIRSVFSLDELTLWWCWGFSLLPTMCHPNTHPGHSSTCQIQGQKLWSHPHMPSGLEVNALSTPWTATYLEVWAGDTFGQLPEQGFHNFHKLRWLNHVQDLLQLI